MSAERSTPSVPHEDLVERVRAGLDYGLGLRHKTRRERRYGELNYWEVDVHEPEGCKRCEVEAALAELHARLQAAERERDEALRAEDVAEGYRETAEARVRELEKALTAIRGTFGPSVEPRELRALMTLAGEVERLRRAFAKETEV